MARCRPRSASLAKPSRRRKGNLAPGLRRDGAGDRVVPAPIGYTLQVPEGPVIPGPTVTSIGGPCRRNAEVIEIKRTYQPKKLHRKRVHGFLKRMSTRGGVRVIRDRRRKGRHELTRG